MIPNSILYSIVLHKMPINLQNRTINPSCHHSIYLLTFEKRIHRQMQCALLLQLRTFPLCILFECCGWFSFLPFFFFWNCSALFKLSLKDSVNLFSKELKVHKSVWWRSFSVLTCIHLLKSVKRHEKQWKILSTFVFCFFCCCFETLLF